MKVYKEKVSEFSEAEFNKYFQMMSPDRKAAVLKKKFESDRKASVLGEKSARKAIFERLGTAEDEIEFSRTENGKPFCVNGNVYFSISHSKDMVVCVADEREIGIDVEFIRDIDLRVMRFACTEKDEEIINSAKEAEKNLLFFKIWTAKEAFIKFCGGVLADLKDFSFEDIKKNCQTFIEDGYVISIYKE